MGEMVKCALCEYEDHWLVAHVREQHDKLPLDYLTQFPEASLASSSLLALFERRAAQIGRESLPKEGFVLIGDVLFPVNDEVPELESLPLPPHYALPEHGALGDALNDAAVALSRGRSTYIHGLPGSGKDAFVHAFSALTRRPAKMFQISPDANIQAWLHSLQFDEKGTFVREGELLLALRDGYLTPSGTRIPYLILLSDFDRASRDQAEALRLILDSIEGRISGFDGRTYKVLPGTLFVATGNSAGSGDVRGRCISSRPIDASLMDRFERVFEFPWMAWEDEGPILQRKFPTVFEKITDAYQSVERATQRLRLAIAGEEVIVEFGHRGLCRWLGHAEDILCCFPDLERPSEVLRRGLTAYLDGMPDEYAREVVKKLLDPYIPGGILKEGDTSHIGARLELDG